jgi:uncharacterized RDD family membrane protein YckC
MTTTPDDYINRVLDLLPRTLPLRAQIGMELRGHIAERVGAGQSVAEVLRQLGDPVVLAESYLTAEPLRAASFSSRALAKLLDLALVVAAMSPLALLPWSIAPLEAAFPLALLIMLIGSSFAFGLYTVIAERRAGRTVGKHVMGLRVVQESGTRITLGQAVIRTVPMFMQFYWVDVMFALFTEKHQRAFELLSKTRVVVASPSNRESI